MKTKFILILSIALIISIFGCITAHANINEAPLNIEEPSTSETAEAVTGIEQNIVYKLYDGTSLNLTYSREPVGSQGQKHVYTDANDSMYWVNTTGEITGFSLDYSYMDVFPGHTGEPIPESEWISENSALRIAEMHVETMYGDIFDELTLESNTITYDAMYSFEYNLYSGVNDCLNVVKCYVDILYDGKVAASTMIGQTAYDACDKTKLEDITAEQLNAIAEANAMAVYMDIFRGVEVENTSLIKNGDNFAVKIDAIVSYYMSDLNEVWTKSETYYYGLS